MRGIEQPLEPTLAHEQSVQLLENRGYRTFVVATVALGLAACSSATVNNETSSTAPETTHSAQPWPTTIPNMSVIPTPEAPAAPACDDPTPEEIAATEAILQNPTDRTYGTNGEDATAGLIALRQEAAAKYGLTVFDYRTYMKPFSDDYYREVKGEGPSQIPLEEFVSMATAFAAQYGITVSVPKTQAEIPSNDYGITVTPQNLATTALDAKQVLNAKSNAMMLVENLGDLPVEFVKQSDLETIVLGDINRKDIAGFADYVKGKLYYVDLLKDLRGNTFNHEMTHLWDGQECNDKGMFADPGYTGLNPKDKNIYLGQTQPVGQITPEKLASVAPYDSHFHVMVESPEALDQLHKLTSVEALDDPAYHDAALAAYNAEFANVVVASDYGFTNAAEDKATMGEKILSTFSYNETLDTRAPIYRSKFVYLLARMYHDDPRIVMYLNEVGNVNWHS